LTHTSAMKQGLIGRFVHSMQFLRDEYFAYTLKVSTVTQRVS